MQGQWRQLAAYHVERGRAEPEYWFHYVRMQYRHSAAFFVLVGLNSVVEGIMARGKSKGQDTGDKRQGGFGEFANIRLDDEHEQAVVDLLERADQVWAEMEGLVSSGYRVSFAYSDSSQAVVCSVTCRIGGHVNEGLTMTAFAESWYDALCVALVKHNIVAKGDWRAVSQASVKRRFG